MTPHPCRDTVELLEVFYPSFEGLQYPDPSLQQSLRGQSLLMSLCYSGAAGAEIGMACLWQPNEFI